MINVIAQFEVKESQIDHFIELANQLISETRKEAGCLSYHLQQNNAQANHLVFVEQWRSQEDLAQHSASAHFTAIVPQLIELCVNAPIIQTFTELN